MGSRIFKSECGTTRRVTSAWIGAGPTIVRRQPTAIEKNAFAQVYVLHAFVVDDLDSRSAKVYRWISRTRRGLCHSSRQWARAVTKRMPMRLEQSEAMDNSERSGLAEPNDFSKVHVNCSTGVRPTPVLAPPRRARPNPKQGLMRAPPRGD